ncbi:MAG: hypothetical protein JNL58_10255 [Planctomyces sp.]|nr:hypothetical protein [Planctomyces sp.]
MNVLRVIVSIGLALLTAIAGFVLVELMSSILHPVPSGFDHNSMEAVCEHVANYPHSVLFACAVGWWLTVAASCWLATRLGVSRHPAHGIVIGLILLAMAVLNMSMLPYPLWFWINVVAFPASTALGISLARRH